MLADGAIKSAYAWRWSTVSCVIAAILSDPLNNCSSFGPVPVEFVSLN